MAALYCARSTGGGLSKALITPRHIDWVSATTVAAGELGLSMYAACLFSPGMMLTKASLYPYSAVFFHTVRLGELKAPYVEPHHTVTFGAEPGTGIGTAAAVAGAVVAGAADGAAAFVAAHSISAVLPLLAPLYVTGLVLVSATELTSLSSGCRP